MKKRVTTLLAACMVATQLLSMTAMASEDATADYTAGEDAPTYVMVSKTLSDPIFRILSGTGL